jgi:hypothetical protein
MEVEEGIRFTTRFKLTSSWNWFLRVGCVWMKPVFELDGSIWCVNNARCLHPDGFNLSYLGHGMDLSGECFRPLGCHPSRDPAPTEARSQPSRFQCVWLL